MITVRQYDPVKDRVVVEDLLVSRDPSKRDFNPKDAIFVAEFEGIVVGVLALRGMPFVHTLEIRPHAMMSQRIAEALLNYGKGYVRASGFQEALFLIEPGNPKMQAFITARGAVQEGPADLFTLQVL